MENGTSTALKKGASILALTLCLSVVQAKAGTAFMWAVDGTNLVGLDSTGTVIASVAAPTGANFFSVAVAGSSNTSENIFVSAPANPQGTLYEYTWNGSALTAANNTFTFAADTTGGGISPQEIALDPSGNLWTVSFDGRVQEYTANCTSPCGGTQILPAGSAIAGARGIMIPGSSNCKSQTQSGCVAYVTYEAGYGSGGLASFAATGTANPSLTSVSTLGATTTTGGQGTGQLRGVTQDQAGNIYYADGTWGAAGTDNGYICNAGTQSGFSCTYANAYFTGLNGPNELITGQGNGSAAGSFNTGCDVLYVAQYYANVITEINLDQTTGGTQNSSSCGTAKQSQTFASGLTNVSGIALAVGDTAVIGGNQGPTNLFSVSAAPEPGTWVLMFSALLSIAGVQLLRRRRAAQA